MKSLKTIIALLLILLMTFTFAACGSSDDGGSDDSASQDQSQDIDDEDIDDEETDDEEIDESDDYFDESDLEEDLDDEDDEDEEEEDEEKPYEPNVPEVLTGDYTGGFRSDTETPLNLVTQWAANKGSDGTYDVSVVFYLECYSLQVSERAGNILTIKTSSGTQKYSFDTKAIDKKDNVLDMVLIGKTSVKLTEEELAEGAKAKVTWDFRGSYSGTDLPEITAEGKIMSN